MAAAILAGCSEELDRGGVYNPEKGVTATIPAYSFDDGTRVNISGDLQTFTWSDGDKIGLYCSENDVDGGAWFTIKQGGSSTGSFSNNMFYLNNELTYYATYPFNSNATIEAVPVIFTGQVQTENGSTSHLGTYNYMCGSVEMNSNGGASIDFHNIGAVMQIDLTVPEDMVCGSLGIYLPGGDDSFITEGIANMKTGNISGTKRSPYLTLSFGEGIAVAAGEVLTANLLVVPENLEGKALNFTLYDKSGEKEYNANIEGKNMQAGKAYKFQGVCTSSTSISVKGVSFTAKPDTIGATYQLEWKVYPENATNKNVTFSYYCYSKTLEQDDIYNITTSSEGLITIGDIKEDCYSYGVNFAPHLNISVTTKDGGYSDEFETEVYIPVTGFRIWSSQPYHQRIYSKVFAYEMIPSNATNQSVTATSSDETIGTISYEPAAGGIPGIYIDSTTYGNITVAVTTNDGGFTETFAVDCEPSYGWALDDLDYGNYNLETPIGETVRLSPSYGPGFDDLRPYICIWTSSDESVATVKQYEYKEEIAPGIYDSYDYPLEGVVTGVGLGKAVITLVCKERDYDVVWFTKTFEIEVVSK